MSAFFIESISEIPDLQVIKNHITVQKASKITGYSEQYLQRLLRAGKMDAMQIG